MRTLIGVLVVVAMALTAGCGGGGTDVATEDAAPAAPAQQEQPQSSGLLPHEVAGLDCPDDMIGMGHITHEPATSGEAVTQEGAEPETALRAAVGRDHPRLAGRVPARLPEQAQADGFYAEKRTGNQLDVVLTRQGKRIARYNVEKAGNNWRVTNVAHCSRAVNAENANA